MVKSKVWLRSSNDGKVLQLLSDRKSVSDMNSAGTSPEVKAGYSTDSFE